MTRPDRRPWAAGLALCLAWACGEGPRTAPAIDCDPVADTGCPADEHCRLRAGGSTVCVEQTEAPAEGCDPSACAAGETCAEVEGLIACRRLCRMDAPDCPTGGQCAYTVTKELGVCVAPCDPFGDRGLEGCQEGTCAPTTAAPFLVCQANGPVRAGEDCTEQRCGASMACLDVNDESQCRTLCRPGSDELCPPPQVCLGQVQDLKLGYCGIAP